MPHCEPKDPKKILALSIAALGVVYGDIGTSILYTFQECFHGGHPVAVTPENILGITSMILWSLLIVVTFKYLWVVMNAENNGEGGILTLLALIPLPFRINSGGTLAIASIFGVCGAALLYGDGIITPAISVLSAMEGIELIDPTYEKYVMPGTVAILALLFFIQRTGTGRIGKFFGVIVLTWFIVVATLGIPYIWRNPEILGAFNPGHAVQYFQIEGFSGIKILGSVILAVTGGEALYADMGHFGRRPIRVAWHFIVLPALMINYLGQAALLLEDPSKSVRPFYSMVEQGPLYYGLVILATMATIIASQALITGAYSLTYQAMRQGLFPRVKVIHTSADMEGRVYIPFINWLLAGACIMTVLFFKKSTNLAAAYGLAVSGTMVLTTALFFFVAYFRWKWNFWAAIALCSVLIVFDSAFLYANALKIPDGGYLPLVIGVFFFLSMATWQYGRAKLSRFYRERSKTMDEFFREIDEKKTRRIPGTLVVLASNENKVPPVLGRLVDSMHVIHEHVILVTVITTDEPFVRGPDKYKVMDLVHNVTRVVIQYGFMEQPDIPTALSACKFSHLEEFPKNEAFYLIGRETFIVDGDTTLERGRQFVFSLMSRNAASASDFFQLPAHQVLELGAQLAV